MNLNSELERLLRAVTKTERCEHIALCSNTQTSTTTLKSHILNLLPEVNLYLANICILRVRLNLLKDKVYLLELEVDNIVHQVHCLVNMLLEEVEVECSLLGKRILYIAEEVDCKQTAAVIRTERNLATRVCRNGCKALVSVAIRHRLADNCIPEKYAWLCRLPRVVDNLAPKLASVDVLYILWIARVDWELLGVCTTVNCSAHKLVINLD